MLKHEEVTKEIINKFYKVYNTLGYGFLEKVYENSMIIELKKSGFEVQQQSPIKVYYEEEIVGDYYADIIVNNKIILELKSAGILSKPHKYQLINYLKATKIEIGLLLNFGEKPEFERVIFSNEKIERG